MPNVYGFMDDPQDEDRDDEDEDLDGPDDVGED